MNHKLYWSLIKSWWTSSLYSHFFSSIWQMQNIWSTVNLLRRKQDVGYNFVSGWQKWYAPIIITICFIPLLMNRYYDRLLPLFRQFLLLPNRSSKFMNLQANCSTPYFNQFCWYLIKKPGDLWLFSLSMASSTSEALGSGTSSSAVCISACPTSLTPCMLNSWEK